MDDPDPYTAVIRRLNACGYLVIRFGTAFMVQNAHVLDARYVLPTLVDVVTFVARLEATTDCAPLDNSNTSSGPPS